MASIMVKSPWRLVAIFIGAVLFFAISVDCGVAYLVGTIVASFSVTFN